MWRGMRAIALAVLVAALAACGSGGGGGGGGGGSSTPKFAIGGTVSGLTGTGLELLLNNAEALPIEADGAFTFLTTVPKGGGYAVTVKTNPTGQTCAVSDGIGTVAAAVSNVAVSCGAGSGSGPAYLVFVSITGLNPAGTGVQLQLNATTSLTAASDGLYPFSTLVPSGGGYLVAVQTQPASPAQNCVVSGGIGVVGGGNVTVNVTCNAPDTYVVGGLVLGLVGSGLELDLNGSEPLPIVADGLFTFTSALDSGTLYTVSVAADPTIPDQTCSVTNGSGAIGSANVSNVLIVCTPPASYTVGGTVTNLVGSGLQLQLNGGTPLSVTSNGAFTFTTTVADASAYVVAVVAQPDAPAQTCAVTNGTGTVNGGSVTNVSVSCTAPASYLIGGAVNGLAGTGFQLLLNGTAVLDVAGDGAFQFTSAPVVDAGNYAVTVQTQPVSPTQSCVVTGGLGIVDGADVSSVSVTCNPPGTFTVGGTVSGLAATGQGLQLRNNTEVLDVSANGAFTFATAVVDAGTYTVTVETQPSSPAQTCSVSSGIGFIATANVTSVSVTCAPPAQYAVGGTVAGLTGSGLKLRLNGSIDVDIEGDGPYAFGTSIVDAGTYGVVVQVQPTGPNQYCSVSSGTGTIPGVNVTNVDITCSAGFTVGGTLSGLLGGNAVTLRNNGGDDLVLSANGGFTFAAAVGVLQAYEVTIGVSPASPAQQCSVSDGLGTISVGNVTNVAVTCSSTPAHTVGGTVSGLTGGGLVLRNNGGDDLPVAASGSFTFVTPVFDGSDYAVSIGTPPSAPSQDCEVTGGSGTMSGSNVTSVGVSCATNAYTIGGSVSGLTGTVTLQNNGGDDLWLAGDGPFTFAAALADQSPFSVTVTGQPAGQFCSVSNGSGALAGGPVTTVGVVCNTLYTIGGTVTGLSGSGLVLQNNGGNNLAIPANGPFTFATTVPNGSGYAVTVLTPPGTPSQTCAITGGGNSDGSGTVSGGSVTDIQVSCTTNTYTVGGTVTGLISSDLVLRKNGTDTLVVAVSGPFTFAVALADLSAYAVTIAAAPTAPPQVCNVTGGGNGDGTGALAGANVTNVTVTCLNNPPTVSVPMVDQALPYQEFLLDLAATFDDSDEGPGPLVLTVDDIAPAGVVSAAFDPGTKDLRLTYLAEGAPVAVTVRATDAGGLSVTDTFTVTYYPALYANGLDWNEYVVSNGTTAFSADDTVCAGTEPGGYHACLHGGEMRDFPVPGRSSCTGLTATDDLDAFAWFCNASSDPVRMQSRALKPERGLADLIDWGSAPAWLENRITVRDGGTPIYTSQPKVWWTNPIVEINAATASGNLNAAGTVYAATAVPATPVNFTFAAHRVALVAMPGLDLQGAAAGGSLVTATSRNFLWLEGNLDRLAPANNSHGVNWGTVKFSAIRNLRVQQRNTGTFSGSGIRLITSVNNLIHNAYAANFRTYGVTLETNSNDNTLWQVTASGNNGVNLRIVGSANNRVIGATAMSGAAQGVLLQNNGAVNANANVVAGVTVANNNSEGFYVLGQGVTSRASGNTVMRLAGVNNTYGLRLNNADNTLVDSLAVVSNATLDINLLGANIANDFTGLLKITNTGTTGAARCRVQSTDPDPGLINNTCTDTGVYGSSVYNNQLSDAVLSKGLSVANTFVAKAAGDTANASDTGGTATWNASLDWMHFDHVLRGWGRENVAAFPNAGHRNRCTTGTCRIWDWRLATGDLGDKGPDGLPATGDERAVAWEQLALPTGDDVLVHDWSGGGSTTLLRNAVEIPGLSAGNNNGLCESGETCLFAPNLGAFQGHGSLVPAGAFTDGVLTGIQLLRWDTNAP